MHNVFGNCSTATGELLGKVREPLIFMNSFCVRHAHAGFYYLCSLPMSLQRLCKFANRSEEQNRQLNRSNCTERKKFL